MSTQTQNGATAPASAPGATLAQTPSRGWSRVRVRVWAVAFIVVGYVAALGVHRIWFNGKPPYTIASGFSVFAVLFVLALAIERMIQPFAAQLGPDTQAAKAERDTPDISPDARFAAQNAVDESRDQTAIVTWGLASGLGFLVSSALNVTVLGAILAVGQSQPWYPADLMLTGFVIGAGTKPLNDLVTRLQNKQ